MLNQIDIYVHDNLGICFWVIPSFVVGVIMVAMYVTHSYRHWRREKKFTKAMDKCYLMDTMEEKERGAENEGYYKSY